MNPRVFVISGPSGVGKSTIIKGVMARSPDLRLSVSCTTRNPRPGEQHGVHYRFLAKDTFEELVAAGEFLEYAQVYDNYYGTDYKHVMGILAEGQHALLDVDSQGAMSIKNRCKGTVFIFISPPSLEVLQQRLEDRKTESPESLHKRMSLAAHEISFAKEYDYVVPNDSIDQAIADVEDIIGAEGEKPVTFELNDQPPIDQTTYIDIAQPVQPQHMTEITQTLEEKVRERVIREVSHQMGSAVQEELLELVQERLQKIVDRDLNQMIRETLKEQGYIGR